MKQLYSAEDVSHAISTLAKKLQRDHQTWPIFISLMQGALPFTTRLMATLVSLRPSQHPRVYCIRATNYDTQNHLQAPRFSQLETLPSLNGESILILDDVLDTGSTAEQLRTELLSRGALTVELAVLVEKDRERSGYFTHATYAALHTQDIWLVGMGMDDPTVTPEAYRWSPKISGKTD